MVVAPAFRPIVASGGEHDVPLVVQGASLRIGILHSLSGPMALSERALVEVERFAVDEINAQGGVLGRAIEPVVVDGRSDAAVFAARAEDLLAAEVRHLFGCWTSASRKATKRVLEQRGGLLWYPVQYEGLEQSRWIVYTGSCLNQQAIPALAWASEHLGGRAYLLGSDYVFPRAANALVRSFLEPSGGGQRVLGERLVPLDARDFDDVVAEIAAAKPDFVVNTLNGESNLWLLRRYAASAARSIPILSFSVGEVELRTVAALAVEHYACWNYFQSLPSPANERFVAALRRRRGEDAVIGAPVVSAYSQLHLWRAAVERADSFEIEAVIERLAGCSFDGPAGRMVIQPNHHVSLRAHVGRLREDGRFDVVWSSPEPLRPLPWLGVEESGLPTASMVMAAMAAFPEVAHADWVLKAEVARRETAERSLRDMAARLERLVSSGIVGFCVGDAAGRISEANDAFLSMVGRSREDVAAGRLRWDAITPEQWRDMDARALARVRERGTVEPWEKEYLHADGHRVPVLVAITRLAPDREEYLCVVLDITERKRVEAELRDSRDEALALNRELDAFVHAVSHDLRGPIFTIGGFARALLEDAGDCLDERGRDHVERVRAAAARMGIVVDHLFQLSRVTHGELRAMETDVSAVVHALAAELRAKGGREVDLVVADGLRARADPVLLRIVLENLLDNAWKFVQRAERPRIEVGAETLDGERVFFVRDNGVGFDPAKASKLFQPFERLHPPAEYPGHGLGLSMVRRIVERHGGVVWAESSPGRGATFRFTLGRSGRAGQGAEG